MGFFDYTDGDYVSNSNGDMAYSNDGHMLYKVSDNMALDMDTGDMHIISSWDDED